MRADGELNLAQVRPVANHLIAQGIRRFYVCGSTGEGPSLTTAERKAVAEAYIEASDGRVPVIVQVGHASLREARDLAAHAEQAGADVVSATAPWYFRPNSVESLADCLAEIAAAAPRLPFYYYHIPQLTGVDMDLAGLLACAERRLPTLAGIKFSTTIVHAYQELIDFDGGRYDILFGCDEMLLSGLVAGGRGAVGSTYNFASPLYRRIWDCFLEGKLDEARHWQSQAMALVRILFRYRGHPAIKAMMRLTGFDCGPTRLPLIPLTDDELKRLRRDLIEGGFYRHEEAANVLRIDGTAMAPFVPSLGRKTNLGVPGQRDENDAVESPLSP